MKPIIVYTPYSCLLKCNGQELELDENEHAILDENEDNIYVYPTGKTKKYSFVINLKETNSKFYSIVEKDNKILVFLIDGLLSENVDNYHLKYNNKNCDIEISQNSIAFISGNHKKHIILNEKPSSFKCGNFNNIYYVLLTFSNNQTLIAYNSKSNLAKQFSGDNIELTRNGFSIKSNSHGIYKKIDEEYYVDAQGLKNKSKSYLLSDQIMPEELIAYQFMLAIKNGDNEHIEALLSDDLKKKLSVDNIKRYFGKISYFYFIDSKTCFAISNGENIIYEFLVKNDKITEIIDNK